MLIRQTLAHFVTASLLLASIPPPTEALRADPCVANGRAVASCFGAGSINATDGTDVLQAALSSNVSYLLIDDIHMPWIVRPLLLSKVTDMVIELQAGVHILAKRNEFHAGQDSLLKIAGVIPPSISVIFNRKMQNFPQNFCIFNTQLLK